MADTGIKLDEEIHITVGAFLSAGTRTKDPKLFSLVPLCKSMNRITFRSYFVHHAHAKAVPLYRIPAPSAYRIAIRPFIFFIL